MVIYLLTFYLFDDFEKISESLTRIIPLRQRQFWQKMQPERLYFLFAFALSIIDVDRCDGKTPKTIILLI